MVAAFQQKHAVFSEMLRWKCSDASLEMFRGLAVTVPTLRWERLFSSGIKNISPPYLIFSTRIKNISARINFYSEASELFLPSVGTFTAKRRKI